MLVHGHVGAPSVRTPSRPSVRVHHSAEAREYAEEARMEPTPLMAQQAAIQHLRAQYERSELYYDAFRRALDALVLAPDAHECQSTLPRPPQSPRAPPP